MRNDKFVECKKNIDYTVEKGKDPSTFDIKMKYGEGGRLDTAVGNIPFNLNGKLNAGDGVSEAKQTVNSNVKDTVSFGERFGNFLKNNWWWLLGLLVLIIIAVGYIPGVKKYFSTRVKSRPMITVVPDVGEPNYKSGRFEQSISRFIPYVPCTGTLKYTVPSIRGVPSAKVKASKNNMVLLTNYKSFVGNRRFKVTFGVKEVTNKPLEFSPNSSIHVSAEGCSTDCVMTRKNENRRRR